MSVISYRPGSAGGCFNKHNGPSDRVSDHSAMDNLLVLVNKLKLNWFQFGPMKSQLIKFEANSVRLDIAL